MLTCALESVLLHRLGIQNPVSNWKFANFPLAFRPFFSYNGQNTISFWKVPNDVCYKNIYCTNGLTIGVEHTESLKIHIPTRYFNDSVSIYFVNEF